MAKSDQIAGYRRERRTRAVGAGGRKENILRLYELLPKVLDERESWIIRRRYGLYNTKPATQREIAKGLGISRSCQPD